MLHSHQRPIRSMHKVDQGDRKGRPYHTCPLTSIQQTMLVVRHPARIRLMARHWHQECSPMDNRIHNHHLNSRCIRGAYLGAQLSTAGLLLRRLHVVEECGYGFRWASLWYLYWVE